MKRKASKISRLELIEQALLKQTKKIEAAEEKIEKEEYKISRIEKDIIKTIKHKPVQTLMQSGLSPTEMGYIHKLFVHKIARHKYIYTLLVTLGIVLIWRGFWETTESMPLLSYPLIALISGVLILWLLEHMTRIN